jgi:hypothetical protein
MKADFSTAHHAKTQENAAACIASPYRISQQPNEFRHTPFKWEKKPRSKLLGIEQEEPKAYAAIGGHMSLRDSIQTF